MSLIRELEIKTDLLIEGMRVEESALEGVGTRCKENINWLFDYNFIQLSPGLQIPGDLILPEGTTVQVCINPKSPYLIRTGLDKIPGCADVAPSRDLKDVDRIQVDVPRTSLFPQLHPRAPRSPKD